MTVEDTRTVPIANFSKNIRKNILIFFEIKNQLQQLCGEWR
jgi:hypothetical protein